MPRKTLDWTNLPACPTCTAEAGEQCLDLRPVLEGDVRTIDYPHTDRRPRNRKGQTRTTGNPYPDRPGDRTKAVKAHLAEHGFDGAKVKSAAGTETVVMLGTHNGHELREALRSLRWAGMRLDTTPSTIILTQK